MPTEHIQQVETTIWNTADAQNISAENSICLVVHKEKAGKIVQKEHCHEQDCFIFSALTFWNKLHNSFEFLFLGMCPGICNPVCSLSMYVSEQKEYLCSTPENSL